MSETMKPTPEDHGREYVRIRQAMIEWRERYVRFETVPPKWRGVDGELDSLIRLRRTVGQPSGADFDTIQTDTGRLKALDDRIRELRRAGHWSDVDPYWRLSDFADAGCVRVDTDRDGNQRPFALIRNLESLVAGRRLVEWLRGRGVVFPTSAGAEIVILPRETPRSERDRYDANKFHFAGDRDALSDGTDIEQRTRLARERQDRDEREDRERAERRERVEREARQREADRLRELLTTA